MKLSCFLVFFLLWVVNSFRTSATVPDSLLTERTIRSIYVNYPDSALRLLDEAEKSPASGIIPFRIDLLRAMCYEIKHDLTAKEICVRRALQNDSIRLVPERKLSSIAMLANILERQNRYEESIGVCHEGIDLARNLACKKEESDMYSVMARVCIGMTNDEMAQEYFQRAVRLLEGTDDVREMSRLSTIYGEYMSFYINRNRMAEAIEIGYRRETVIQRMSGLPGPPPGYIDQQYGFLYAKMAVLLHDEGKKEEATEIFRKYQSTSFSKTLIGKQYSVPYLLNINQYAVAAALSDTCISAFTNDTVSYEYLILLNYRARASRGMKRFDLADVFTQRGWVVQDSIYTRESKSKAQEYASKFELKEKELQLAKSHALSERRMLLLAGSCVLTVLLIIILWTTFVNLQKTKMRNRIAAKQIDELLAQREELRKVFTQTRNTHETTKEIGTGSSLPEEETLTAATKTDVAAPGTNSDENYAKFMKMESQLIEQKLFLKPGFGRDDLIRVTDINKNDLSPLLRRYAGSDNFNDYLNGLKIEYSIKLMKEKPYLSVDAIAEEANFNSRSTFYRAFVKISGMTPAQYMRTKIE